MPSGGICPRCSVPNCNNKHFTKKCCYEHWLQIRREPYGELAIILGFEKCSSDLCDRVNTTRGTCSKCYERLRKHANPYTVLKPRYSTCPIGHEIQIPIDRGGTVYIKQPQHKLANKLGYVKKAIIIWEKETGDICIKKDRFAYKDGNPSNITIHNIILIPKTKTIKICKKCREAFPSLRNNYDAEYCSKKCGDTSRRGKRHTGRLFSDEETKNIRSRIYLGETIKKISKEKKVTPLTISMLVKGKSYADVPFPPY